MQVPAKAPLEVMATPSHIVVLFNATAGKNGEDVGVDEEQIVLFVYLLYDVTNNKVVAVQSHYVRPQPNELSETLLTEDCKTETGLDEEAIKNSQPLEHVLDEFDRFLSAKGVHPNHGGKSFCLCMDGPAHLRQCIHAEASNKNIQLSQYFYKFFDIRKEFKKFYKASHITCIKEILEYLGLEADQSVEYGIRQCQEMAKIIQRLINDGHVFSQPDIVSERLEPGICSKNEHVDDSTVVRARGLPWQSSDQDIARFFKGLNIARGGVALCLSQQGRRNGEALIRFENEENRDLALKRHKHHIGQRYIEVYKASGKDFVNVAGGCNTEAQIFLSRGGQAIIRMRGLPFTATTQHVLEFFARDPNAVTVLDGEDGILFVHYPDGRATGDAFVLFSTEDEANRAIKKHREMMGSRYIELFKSTTAEVQQVLNRSMDPRVPDQPEAQITPLITQLPQQTSVPLVPQNMITSGTRKDCIRLRHLPNGAQVTDILTFLAEFSQFIVYQGVHMVYNAQGEPSGEAFIQMDSEESAQLTSLNRHRKPMIFSNKKRIIDVIQCSGEDMSLVLTNGYPTAVTFQQPTTPVVQRPIISPNLALMGQTMKSPLATQIPEVPLKHSISPVFPSPGSNPILPTGLTSPFSYAAQLSQLSQLSQPLPGAFPSPLTHIPQRPAYYPSPILYWYPSPPVSPQSYYTQAQTGPAVVVMRGLPFNASIQDILAFFQSYPEVGPESIQIQQNTDGRPNGDALVTFASRSEAERAIAERNRQNIGNRYIELFLAERAAV